MLRKEVFALFNSPFDESTFPAYIDAPAYLNSLAYPCPLKRVGASEFRFTEQVCEVGFFRLIVIPHARVLDMTLAAWQGFMNGAVPVWSLKKKEI